MAAAGKLFPSDSAGIHHGRPAPAFAAKLMGGSSGDGQFLWISEKLDEQISNFPGS
jgi:hypothetical protein